MAAASTPKPERDPRWAALAAPFPPDQVEKLPKLLNRNDQRKGRCREGTEEGRYVSADGHYCGGWHARSMHLDYVGHAGITMRLNDVVGPENWSWEPVAVDETGIPFHARGEFWIRLTILGVTKLGVGDDYNGSSKQAIGDALRNAAMRFGIGTYLWSKSDAAAAMAAHTEPAGQPPAVQGQPLAAVPAPAEQAQQPTAEAGEGVDEAAQLLADTAKRVRSMGSLRTTHTEAQRKNLLAASVAHPDTGQILTLGMYLNQRREQLAAGQEQTG